MKDLMKILAVLFIMATAATTANAQTLKFGHIDMGALIQIMPERATAETEFNKFQGELEEIFGDMQNQYQTKLQEFEQLGDSASEIKRNAKIAEVQDIQSRIQNYQATAQQQLQQKQNDVMKPIIEKANNAIESIAKEQGLIYVFESNNLLYKSTQSIDLLPLVKAKLGIQ